MEAREPRRVKPVVSVFTADRGLFRPVFDALAGRLGQPDFLSETMPFDFTVYYDREFGPGPKWRRLISFESLIKSEALVDLKIFTNSLEGRFLAGPGKRRVNIDPGYVNLERFVLASCKDFSHRIHLGRGVYADLTLVWREGAFRDLEWTYPDYRTPLMKRLLIDMRMRYAFAVKGAHA